MGTPLLAFAVAAAALAAVLSASPDSVTARPDAVTYEIDTVHSSAVFRIGHLGLTKFYGNFDEMTGSFTLGGEGGGSVRIEIPVESLDTRNERRDGHLKSPDFFNAKQFPKMTFESAKMTKTDSGYEVTGKLTMHGVTKEITVEMEHSGPAEGMRGETRAGFHGTFTIDRTEYGIDWNPDVLGTEVWIALGVEGVKK